MPKKKLFPFNVNCIFLSVRPTSNKSTLDNLYPRKLHMRCKDSTVNEIKIPVQWGHVSAKLWGNHHQQPILALHGWQDNAGTWAPLAPTLSKIRPILAIDFPGHGLSSWIPPGLHYHPWDLPCLILYIKEYFKWKKVSLLTHGMGSVAGLRFASALPEEVDFYVAVDGLMDDNYDLNPIEKHIPKLRQIQVVQNRLGLEPPSFALEELAKIWHIESKKSISMNSLRYLIERGVKKSTSSPGKYFFSKDPRLKTMFLNPESKKFVKALVQTLKCPTLYIKAIESPYASDEFSIEIRKVIQTSNQCFECHFLTGTHHLHLNDPDAIAPYIQKFLLKHNVTIC